MACKHILKRRNVIMLSHVYYCYYGSHKTKEANKQPKISKTEEIHKSWCNQKQAPLLTLMICKYYLVVENIFLISVLSSESC